MDKGKPTNLEGPHTRTQEGQNRKTLTPEMLMDSPTFRNRPEIVTDFTKWSNSYVSKSAVVPELMTVVTNCERRCEGSLGGVCEDQPRNKLSLRDSTRVGGFKAGYNEGITFKRRLE